MMENTDFRSQAQEILSRSIEAVLPEAAVREALRGFVPGKGKTVLVAAGKAAWRMAKAAKEALPEITGLVITKYGHSMGELSGITVLEAGHPVPDANSFAAGQAALELVSPLGEDDTVLFLLSGGASALFEAPAVAPEVLEAITGQLLRSGADIVEMNTVRKRLSRVKGGRFALACAPAHVEAVVLSDVLGDRLDAIGSGPAAPDPTTCGDARSILEKYGISLPAEAMTALMAETPKTLTNVHSSITGSVTHLTRAAAEVCEKLGYEARILTCSLTDEASDTGRALARRALSCKVEDKPIALLMGGETVVHVTGTGLGGRNQELALAAGEVLDGTSGVCVFSFGSDGTDGPTDAAGGYADGTTWERIRAAGLDPAAMLRNNDAYHALKAADDLLITGPTGTNVNDVSVALIGVSARCPTDY